MSLLTFLFYSLVRLKSIIVFLVSLYGFISLTLDQLCLEKVPSSFKHSQSIDLFDQLTLHFDGEPYLSPHIYDLTHKGGERYNRNGFPINCEIKHSLPSVDGKNRTIEYGDFFNEVVFRKKGKEIFQYNYTIKVSNKITIKNFTRNLKIFYDLDNNGMFKSSLMLASQESCSMDAEVAYNQLICKKPENLDEIYFSFIVSFVSIYVFFCIWTRFSKGLSRRLMFRIHELFSETKGFEFCNEYTKSWIDFKDEACYVEKNFDELDGDGMETAFIGGKFYRIFSNEAFVSDGSKTERLELNITSSQYANLLKYVRILNISVKNCFVDGTHFLTLKQVLEKYNKDQNFYVGIRENLTDRIMDPEDKFELVDSFNFNLLMRSCPECCPKKIYKLYYHFLKFQTNYGKNSGEPSLISKNCSFLGSVLNKEKVSISPFKKPSFFKNSSWKYYISDLWKLLNSMDINMKEPFEKRKDSEALKKTLNLNETFLEKEIEALSSVKKMKISDLIDSVGVDNPEDPCCLVFGKVLSPEKEMCENDLVESPEDIYKKRVKVISKEIIDLKMKGVSEIEDVVEEAIRDLDLKKSDLGLEDESWESLRMEIKSYKEKYSKAGSKRLKEKIYYENGAVAEISESIDELTGKIMGLSGSKKSELVLSVKDRKIYIDELSLNNGKIIKTKKEEKRRSPSSDVGKKKRNKAETKNKVESENQIVYLPFKDFKLDTASPLKDKPFSPTYVFLEIAGIVEGLNFRVDSWELIKRFNPECKLFTSPFESNDAFKNFSRLINGCNFYEVNYISKLLGLENYLTEDGELNYELESDIADKSPKNEIERGLESDPEFRKNKIKKHLGEICNKGVIEIIREESEFYKRRLERKIKEGKRKRKGKNNKNKSKSCDEDCYENVKLKENNRFRKSSEVPCLVLALNLILSKGKFSKNKIYLKETKCKSITPCCNHLVKRYVYFLNETMKNNKNKGKNKDKNKNKDRLIGEELLRESRDKGPIFKKCTEMVDEMINRVKEISKTTLKA